MGVSSGTPPRHVAGPARAGDPAMVAGAVRNRTSHQNCTKNTLLYTRDAIASGYGNSIPETADGPGSDRVAQRRRRLPTDCTAHPWPVDRRGPA